MHSQLQRNLELVSDIMLSLARTAGATLTLRGLAPRLLLQTAVKQTRNPKQVRHLTSTRAARRDDDTALGKAHVPFGEQGAVMRWVQCACATRHSTPPPPPHPHLMLLQMCIRNCTVHIAHSWCVAWHGVRIRRPTTPRHLTHARDQPHVPPGAGVYSLATQGCFDVIAKSKVIVAPAFADAVATPAGH